MQNEGVSNDRNRADDSPGRNKKGQVMLTNFISEAANEIHCTVPRSVSNGASETETEETVIIRNTGSEKRAARETDIYDRARVIYFRAKRPYRARSANIL